LQPWQAAGKDEDQDDTLLNPAHALVGAYGANKAMAAAFVDWLIEAEGGQKTIRDFAVNGEVLYTVAPSGVDPLARARDVI
jgi:ABC-type tungstate transport system permease subunit